MAAVGRTYAGEYHCQHYNNKRANAPWWRVFEYGAWTVNGALDWVLPLIISILVSVIV